MTEKVETRGAKKGPAREGRSYLLLPATIDLISEMAYAARCSRREALEELITKSARPYINNKLKGTK